MRKKKNVLDSFALVSFFHKEPGWQKISKLFYELASSKERAVLNIVNWGEFYYVVRRRVGKRKADEALVLLDQLPVDILETDRGLVKDAAEIKADFPVSYADAFCVATARRVDGRILTNDREFEAVQHLVPVVWLAAK